MDSGAGAHVCSNVQALKGSRKLAKGEMQFKFGDGALVAAETVGDLELILPTGLILQLSSVYFIPHCNKNIIFVSCLDSQGYVFSFKNKYCIISRNNIVYASAFLFKWSLCD